MTGQATVFLVLGCYSLVWNLILAFMLQAQKNRADDLEYEARKKSK